MSAVLQPSAAPASREPLADARTRVAEGLRAAAERAHAQGMPLVVPDGQLLRPLIAYAGAAGDEIPAGSPFWAGAVALQLAHEASLVHDDVIDRADTRRGRPTAVATAGVAGALVLGDHLLTAAYRVAAATGSLAFIQYFTRAVERTVAGEVAQAKAVGERLDRARYEAIALGKAGELMGCSLALAPLLAGRGNAEEWFELGRQLGLLYQMLDDLLDYCPAAGTGKPALADYVQRHWTWPLDHLPGIGFGRPVEEVLAAFRAPSQGMSPLDRCLDEFEQRLEAVECRVQAFLPDDHILLTLLDAWRARARRACASGQHSRRGGALRFRSADAAVRERVPETTRLAGYLARNSRSFRFASLLLPAGVRQQVEGVYAYCRVTDDLVDRPGAGSSKEVEALLAQWLELSRAAYRGERTGIALLDRVMGDTAAAQVPFRYAEELVEGMRMDLRRERFLTPAELRVYTYRVASVVGLWLTELFGVREPAVLQRAAALGHAMQLTNILRDVGEDWRRGRLYLPLKALERYGVTEEALARGCRGGELPGGYPELVEELLRSAEAEYQVAFTEIPALPRGVQLAIASAAHVYRGIHREIRRNGYDNLTRRAHTGGATKLGLLARAAWDLQLARRERSRPLVTADLPGVVGLEGPR